MSSKELESKFTYFQFNKNNDFPIYVKVQTSDFDPDLISFLRSLRFEELSNSEADIAKKTIESSPRARVLNIEEASLVVARQIAGARESDRYGAESIVTKTGYKVYRYRNIGMMVFSMVSKEWKLGCFPDFGNVDNEIHCRVVINRFLSWALAPLGYIGFWGTPVEEGLVIQRYIDTKGEAVFINVMDRTILSMDGEKRLRYNYSLIRLDPILRERSTEMSFETLLSFLSVNNTYFGETGQPDFVRQMLQTLAKMSAGINYPKDNFRPRQPARLD